MKTQYQFAFKQGRIGEDLLVTSRNAGLPEPLSKNFIAFAGMLIPPSRK